MAIHSNRTYEGGNTAEINQDGMEEDIEELDDSSIRPKIKMCVQNMLKDGAEEQARVQLKQPKQPKWTGLSKNWDNVETITEEESSSINWY